MYKKPITYTDYNGVERTEDFYFNLSKAELLEMEIGRTGGYGDIIQRIIKAKDNPAIFMAFKELILKAYGEKSLDGRQFRKSPEISAAFEQTEAFSELIMEFCTNEDAAADFVNNVIPKNLGNAVAKEGDTINPLA